jgi:hypothetical protein
MTGAIFDAVIIKVTNRLQAIGLGIVLCAPLVDIVQITLNTQGLTSRQLAGGLLVGGVLGAIGGLIGWWPSNSS